MTENEIKHKGAFKCHRMYTEKCSSQKTGDESIQKPIIYSQEALILDACSGCKSAELIFLVQGSGKSVGVKLCSNT